MPEKGVYTQEKSMVTVKNTLRILAILCLIFIFCPTLCVSCAEQEFHVSAVTAIKGLNTSDKHRMEDTLMDGLEKMGVSEDYLYSSLKGIEETQQKFGLYGETLGIPRNDMTKSYPIMIISIILPLIVLGFLWKRIMEDKNSSLVIAACAGVDFIVWLIFALETKSKAQQFFCKFDVTIWYWLNMLVLLLLMIIAMMVVLEKATMENQLRDLLPRSMSESIAGMTQGGLEKGKQGVSAVGKQFATTPEPNSNPQTSNNYQDSTQQSTMQDTDSFCCECGSLIKSGQKFCPVCGTKIPEES